MSILPIWFKKISPILVCLLLETSCSTSPTRPNSGDLEGILPQTLAKEFCQIGKNINTANGTAWFKIASKEISGQYSVHVKASKQKPLQLEIMNFLGGSEANIEVSSDRYKITKTKGDSEEIKERKGNWNGIPLKWANELFLGNIPCPPLDQPPLQFFFVSNHELKITWQDPNTHIDEQFIYEFRVESHESKKRFWPDSLHWKQLNHPEVWVDLKFDDIDETHFIPKKWEARSSQGALKIKWQDRNIEASKDSDLELN